MLIFWFLFVIGCTLSYKAWYSQNMQLFTFAAIDAAFCASILLIYYLNKLN